MILYIADGLPLVVYFFVSIKMSCYWFNRKELLKIAHEKYHNKEAKKEQKILSRKQRSHKKERKKQVRNDVKSRQRENKIKIKN